MYHQYPQRSLWDVKPEDVWHEMHSMTPNLSDPADRLAVITELRKLGYTVEPGGNS